MSGPSTVTTWVHAQGGLIEQSCTTITDCLPNLFCLLFSSGPQLSSGLPGKNRYVFTSLARKCCCWREFQTLPAHSNRAHMLTSRISRHARISGDCPVCLYPLQGRNITKRPCEHMLCTPCYLDGVSMGFRDATFNPDACEQCRNTPVTKTRAGSTLITTFTSSKQLIMVSTAKAPAKSRGPRRVPEGPRAGFAGSAGTGGHGKSKRPAEGKLKKKVKKAKTTKGGYTLANRGDLRSQGIKIPVGGENTCLPDAFWPLADHLRPELKLKLNEVRDAIMPGDGTDPCLHTAMVYAATLGMDLAARSDINSPRLLWSQDSGCYLAQLNVQTDDSADSHFVAYLALCEELFFELLCGGGLFIFWHFLESTGSATLIISANHLGSSGIHLESLQ